MIHAKSYIIMIANRQYQPQLPVFCAEHIISNRKVKPNTSFMDYTGFRERQEYKKKIIKRSSCHNISADNRQNQSEQFSNKLLDHLFTQIKNNHKASLKQANQKTIIHAMTEKSSQQPIQSNELNRQNNLKIRSINNFIKPKSESANRNKAPRTPFQNKKLMNLRKGKSYTLYTQQVEPEIVETSNEQKILPWEFYNNHIIDPPGVNHQIDDEAVEEHYLKSHNLKLKEQKPAAKYNTLAFSPPEDKRPAITKYSSIDVTRHDRQKAQTNKFTQVFSAHTVKERGCRPMRNRGKNENIKRTLTQMKMDIQQIQLEKPDNSHLKNIKLEEFFECNLPKNIFSRKLSINHPVRPTQPFRKDLNASIANCFLLGRKL